MTVLVFNFITDESRHNTKYCHFFVTSVLVKNSQRVNGERTKTE